MNEEVEAFARSARLTENERVTLINLLSKHANQSISTHMEQVVLPVRQEVHIVAADLLRHSFNLLNSCSSW